MALLSYADAFGNVKNPIINMDWRTIRSATLTLEGCCVDGQHSGGVWVVNGTYVVSLPSLQVPLLFRFPFKYHYFL